MAGLGAVLALRHGRPGGGPAPAVPTRVPPELLQGYVERLLNLDDFELLKWLLLSKKNGIQNYKCHLKEQDLKAYLYSLSQPGALTSLLNYYRNLFSKLLGDVDGVLVPTLVIWGDRDLLLEPEISLLLVPYLFSSCHIERIPMCSHWVPEDQPERVNQLIWSFLQDND
ncbi:hypothetical protein Y1Q_0017126 [Alligator mississippiensis]|uniref:AB hydrolase-1 domain-containing protein n=1 Tax=Alligator mississippiensis TaxID=8496 RepID=A0A151PH53_ALLMI|nr:hypothetical protein Y1Q_0017126 [Alligator mississippiensis]